MAIEKGTQMAFLSVVALVGVELQPRHLHTVVALQKKYGSWAVFLRNYATGEEFHRYLKEFDARFIEVIA